MEYVAGCDLEMLWRELTGSSADKEVTRLDGSTWAEAVQSASRKLHAQTAAAAKVEQRWYYTRDGEKIGPLTWERLRQLIATDELKPADMVLCEGASSWEQASSVEGLFTPVAAPEPLAPVVALPQLPELSPDKDDQEGYIRRVARMMHEAALALQAIHDQHMIHRDVKPANLMLTADGSRIVLMDLGLAKGQSLATAVTRGGGLLGTLRYAAPEQLAAASLEVGPAADVRGLGVTFWELFTRRRLFDKAEDEKQLAQMVHETDVPPLRTVDRSFDADLEAILVRATERRTADRIPSAGRLAQYLQMYLDGEPLPIRPLGTSELVRRWVRAHRSLVGSIASILMILVVATVFAFILVTDAKNRAIRLAGEARLQGRFDDAIALLRQALVLDSPLVLDARLRLGELLLMRRHTDEAAIGGSDQSLSEAGFPSLLATRLECRPCRSPLPS